MSGQSTSISVTTQAAVDTTPPVISSIAVSSITYNSATISWMTNENSNTQVEYGLTTGYGSQTVLNSSLVALHSQSLSGLSASTLYHYRVKSRDAAGNLATSRDYTFTTTVTVSCTAPSITSQPQNKTIQSGQTANLSVIASGSTPLSYQWYRGSSGNTSTPVGTNSSSYTTPALTQTTSYWVRVTNSCGSANSNTATITVTVP
ncbi:MAG: Ig-like domain-containing protein [Syntrophales bacterium]